MVCWTPLSTSRGPNADRLAFRAATPNVRAVSSNEEHMVEGCTPDLQKGVALEL